VVHVHSWAQLEPYVLVGHTRKINVEKKIKRQNVVNEFRVGHYTKKLYCPLLCPSAKTPDLKTNTLWNDYLECKVLSLCKIQQGFP
jgi:hypothetical protein